MTRRRRSVVAAAAVAGIAVAAAIWLVVTGLLAREQLSHARAGISQLDSEISTGDLTAARVTAAVLAAHAHRAHELTTGPAWAVAAKIPGAGAPARSARGIAASIDELSQRALPELVQASSSFQPAELRRPDGTFVAAGITAATGDLDQALAQVSSTITRVGQLPASTWLPPVDSGRKALAGQLLTLQHDVTAIDTAAHVLAPMLGDNGVQHYFVVFQNEAEARGTGGLPGAFAIMVADHGKLSFSRFESGDVLKGVSADVDFGPQYDQLYDGAGTTTLYGNANLSPNFPYAAQIWSSMWAKVSGQVVDGVISIDPTALGYLLGVTGPVQLADGTQVSETNVVQLTESVAYSTFATDNLARRNYLLDVASAVGAKLVAPRISATALIRAAVHAADEQRVLVWSRDPAIERRLTTTPLAGAIIATDAPYVGLSIVNDGGNKLDYYLDRSLTWQRQGCGALRAVTATITLTNNAPASGLSTYVTNRSDPHDSSVRPGDNRLEVSYLATSGALMTSVTVDGAPATASIGSEHGHPLYTVDLELPRGTSRTIVLHLTEPAGIGTPIVLHQALVRPLDITIDDHSCS